MSLALRTVLVPVDFTETSERALDYAVELAAKFDAEVIALHAYEIPVWGFPDGALVANGDVAARLSTAAQNALDTLVAARKARGGRVTAKLTSGVAYEEVARVADEVKADMVVIGTHGRRGIARALLGSVAENVIRTLTRCPVLVVHGPRE